MLENRDFVHVTGTNVTIGGSLRLESRDDQLVASAWRIHTLDEAAEAKLSTIVRRAAS
jgi:hypothetical protein